jgi:hypothetical protein
MTSSDFSERSTMQMIQGGLCWMFSLVFLTGQANRDLGNTSCGPWPLGLRSEPAECLGTPDPDLCSSLYFERSIE